MTSFGWCLSASKGDFYSELLARDPLHKKKFTFELLTFGIIGTAASQPTIMHRTGAMPLPANTFSYPRNHFPPTVYFSMGWLTVSGRHGRG